MRTTLLVIIAALVLAAPVIALGDGDTACCGAGTCTVADTDGCCCGGDCACEDCSCADGGCKDGCAGCKCDKGCDGCKSDDGCGSGCCGAKDSDD
ncbi:MAG: hypothetical protein NTW26_05870 [bacterium]|nr:hypothetical protein [bacterium]